MEGHAWVICSSISTNTAPVTSHLALNSLYLSNRSLFCLQTKTDMHVENRSFICLLLNYNIRYSVRVAGVLKVATPLSP